MIIGASEDVGRSASASLLQSALPTLVAITSSAMNHTLPHPKLPKAPSHKDDPDGWSSLIGIITAICGNVLISIALNTQRYAHIRLSEQLEQKRRLLRIAERRRRQAGGNGVAGGQNGYEQRAGKREQRNGRAVKIDRLNGRIEDADEPDELAPLLGRRDTPSEEGYTSRENDEAEFKSEEIAQKSYLKSTLWWVGIVLMIVGEAGNFLAYGFAPASIVSPLGVVAIISNCIIAPFFMKEHFRFRDFLGVVVAVGGAVTVVLSASENNPKLGPHEIWDLITTWEFETYLAVTSMVIVALLLLTGKYGSKSIFIDLGLVGLFGGYTALSTKGVASLLSYTLFQALTFPVTYLLVAVLVFTAVMQIKYVNRALQSFDATQVIPTQFVLFTLSVILGSAVLYRDFEKTPGEDAGKFIGGCAMTFIGVWLITSARPSPDDDEEDFIDEDDEAIVLRPGEQYSTEGNVAIAESQASLPSVFVLSEPDSDRAQAANTSRSPGHISQLSLPDSLERNHWGQSSTSSSTTAPPRRRTSSSTRENVPPGLAVADPVPVNENPWTGSSQHSDLPEQERVLKSKSSSIQRLLAAFFPETEREHFPTNITDARHSAPDVTVTSDSSLPGSTAPTPRISPHNTNQFGTSLPSHVQDNTPIIRHHSPSISTLYPGAFPSPLSSSLSAMVTNSIRRSRAGGGSVSSRRRRSMRPRIPNSSTEAMAGSTTDDLPGSQRRGTTASERSIRTTTTGTAAASYIDDEYESDETTTLDSPANGSARRGTLRLSDRLGNLFLRARARITSSNSLPGRGRATEGREPESGSDAV